MHVVVGLRFQPQYQLSYFISKHFLTTETHGMWFKGYSYLGSIVHLCLWKGKLNLQKVMLLCRLLCVQVLASMKKGWYKSGDNSWCYGGMCCWAGDWMGWCIVHTWRWKCPEVCWPSVRADGSDSLRAVSLWAWLSWSVQSVADTQGER